MLTQCACSLTKWTKQPSVLSCSDLATVQCLWDFPLLFWRLDKIAFKVPPNIKQIKQEFFVLVLYFYHKESTLHTEVKHNDVTHHLFVLACYSLLSL